MENSEKPNRDYEAEIRFMLQRMDMLGANNYEPSMVAEILEAYRKKDITGDEAVSRVGKLLDIKEDYH